MPKITDVRVLSLVVGMNQCDMGLYRSEKIF